jgi:UDP-N-acetyl-D-mannosaminuronic acid transferase (WecB/TagA/CpsF family)
MTTGSIFLVSVSVPSTSTTLTGVHGLMESRRDQRLRRVHNEAGMVTPDGMPLVWLLRLLGGGMWTACMVPI